MFGVWSKLFHIWLWLLVFFIILVFLFWPFISLTDDRTWFSVAVSEETTKESNILPVNSLPVANLKESENILVFGGDIMLSRSVNDRIEKFKDYTWPLLKIYPLFKEADLAIANLESPFKVDSNYRIPANSFLFKANPQSVATLSLAGLDILSLANNHILNQGEAGLKDTKNILDEADINYVGLNSSNIVIKERNGIKFAFLAYTYNSDSLLISDMSDISRAETEIKQAKNKADIVIVLMHAGTEYQRTPNNQQTKFAHAIISAGADLVVGTHPHWPQKVENYQGKTIIYSLGNLVFDQMWSKETSVGLVAKIHFIGKKMSKIDYIPIIIKDYGQAEVMASGDDYNKLLESIGVANNSIFCH